MFFDIMIYGQVIVVSFMMIMFLYKYMLVILLMIEFLVVNISLVMFLVFSISEMEYFLIYYLVFSVCEGVLGLSVLVMVVRFYGSELYLMLNMSKF